MKFARTVFLILASIATSEAGCQFQNGFENRFTFAVNSSDEMDFSLKSVKSPLADIFKCSGSTISKVNIEIEVKFEANNGTTIIRKIANLTLDENESKNELFEGLLWQSISLVNRSSFPELDHCSNFSLMFKALDSGATVTSGWIWFQFGLGNFEVRNITTFSAEVVLGKEAAKCISNYDIILNKDTISLQIQNDSIETKTCSLNEIEVKPKPEVKGLLGIDRKIRFYSVPRLELIKNQNQTGFDLKQAARCPGIKSFRIRISINSTDILEVDMNSLKPEPLLSLDFLAKLLKSKQMIEPCAPYSLSVKSERVFDENAHETVEIWRLRNELISSDYYGGLHFGEVKKDCKQGSPYAGYAGAAFGLVMMSMILVFIIYLQIVKRRNTPEVNSKSNNDEIETEAGTASEAKTTTSEVMDQI